MLIFSGSHAHFVQTIEKGKKIRAFCDELFNICCGRLLDDTSLGYKIVQKAASPEYKKVRKGYQPLITKMYPGRQAPSTIADPGLSAPGTKMYQRLKALGTRRYLRATSPELPCCNKG